VSAALNDATRTIQWNAAKDFPPERGGKIHKAGSAQDCQEQIVCNESQRQTALSFIHCEV
jgi:hypothetical protein